MNKDIKLGGLFYPVKNGDRDISFESLFIPYIYREIYMEGIYIDVLNGKKDMTIVDVGSNIGVTVQHFRDHAKKVYAIEPSSEHFEALKKNKEFNGWDNVEVFNMAIDDHDGEEEINKNPKNRTCNSLAMKFDGGESEKVKVMAMDTFFEENKIDHVDFMKFDVEGAEDIILRSEGFKKVAPKIDSIEVEFHFKTWPQLVEYMMSLGYQARRYDSSAIVVLFFK